MVRGLRILRRLPSISSFFAQAISLSQPLPCRLDSAGNSYQLSPWFANPIGGKIGLPFLACRVPRHSRKGLSSQRCPPMSNPSTQSSDADSPPGSPPSHGFRSHPGSPYSVPENYCLETAALSSLGPRTIHFLVLGSLDSPAWLSGVVSPPLPCFSRGRCCILSIVTLTWGAHIRGRGAPLRLHSTDQLSRACLKANP